MKFLILVIALLASIPASADFTGMVIKVADGDTITVMRGKQKVRVRLAEIDAPEKNQVFGNVSHKSLSGLVGGKAVRIVELGQDRYKRTIGKVYIGNLDVCAEQVKLGMAWAYRKYAKDKSLLTLELEAKMSRRGLWAADSPIAPWKWRKSRTAESS